jgi:hypothetical protein
MMIMTLADWLAMAGSALLCGALSFAVAVWQGVCHTQQRDRRVYGYASSKWQILLEILKIREIR